MNNSKSSRIIRNTAWLYVKIAVNMFILLFTTRLILIGLGAIDYGIFNIVGGAINMLGFLYGAMSNATQRFLNYAEGEGDYKKKTIIFNVSIIVHLVIAILITFLLVCAGFVFFNGVLNIPEDRLFASYVVYGSLIVSTAFTIISVPYDSVLISHENLKYTAIIGIFESFLKLLVAVACVYTTSDKLVLYGILMACIPILLRIIMRVYCHRKYTECCIDFRKYFDYEMLKRLTGFAGWNFLTSVSSLFAHYGLGLTLNHFYGTLLNAAQGIASQVSGALMTLSSNAMKAINPVLTKSEGAKEKQQVFYLISVGSRYNYLLFAFFSIPFIIFCPTLLNFWLKEVPEWAVLFCQLQLVRNLFAALAGNMASAVYAQGNIRNYTIVKSIFNFLPLPVVYVAFYYGCPPYWMYIFWIVFWEVFGGFTISYYCKKVADLSLIYYLREVLVPCIIITIGSFLVLFLSKLTNDVYIIILFCILYLFVFCSLSWLFAIKRNERGLIIQYTSTFVSRFFKYA